MQLESKIYGFITENNYYLKEMLKYADKADIDIRIVMKKRDSRRDIEIFIGSGLEAYDECVTLSWGEKE